LAWIIDIEACRPAQGCFVTLWVDADDLGVACEHALSYVAGELQLADARPHSVEVADEAPPVEFEEWSRDLWYAPAINTWDLVPSDPNFRLPVGVVFARESGDLDPDDVTEAYELGQETEYSWVEAVVDQHRLRDTFRAMFLHLPSPDGLELRVCWESGDRVDVYVAPKQFSEIRILRHLLDNWSPLVENGFCELAVYDRGINAILRITDHKTIFFTSGEAGPRDDVARKLVELGYAERTPLRSITGGFHHYHYNLPAAPDCDGLVELCKSWEFRKVDQIELTSPDP
jgi:hypothetical protein